MNVSKISKNLPIKSINNPLNIKGHVALVNAKIYSPDGYFKNGELLLDNGKILTEDMFIKSGHKDTLVYNLKGNYITPSLVDQHIHGGLGISFNTADESQIRNLLTELKKFGHGDILATFVPDTIEKLNSQMDVIRKIIKNPAKNETRIAGINLEGPFLNPEKAGIHPKSILLTPSIENLKKLNLQDVKIITIAPELDKDYKAIEYLNSMNIVTSAGHSTADAEQVRNSKVKQVTHLFNAMSGFHHRKPTIANEGLLNDNISAEVNTAIELLDPDTVKLIMRAKPKDKIILISDALNGANIKEKYFYMGGKRIDIDENGVAKDKDGILAGSIKFMSQVVKRLIDTTQMTFADFIKFASVNPAKNIGIEADYKLVAGAKPNFTIWNKETLLPEKTFIKGE